MIKPHVCFSFSVPRLSPEVLMVCGTDADFPLVVPVILRLSSLEGGEIHEFPELMERAVGCLEKSEEKTKLEVTSPRLSAVTPQLQPPPPPHLAQSLHSPLSLSDWHGAPALRCCGAQVCRIRGRRRSFGMR